MNGTNIKKTWENLMITAEPAKDGPDDLVATNGRMLIKGVAGIFRMLEKLKIDLDYVKTKIEINRKDNFTGLHITDLKNQTDMVPMVFPEWRQVVPENTEGLVKAVVTDVVIKSKDFDEKFGVKKRLLVGTDGTRILLNENYWTFTNEECHVSDGTDIWIKAGNIRGPVIFNFDPGTPLRESTSLVVVMPIDPVPNDEKQVDQIVAQLTGKWSPEEEPAAEEPVDDPEPDQEPEEEPVDGPEPDQEPEEKPAAEEPVDDPEPDQKPEEEPVDDPEPDQEPEEEPAAEPVELKEVSQEEAKELYRKIKEKKPYTSFKYSSASWIR
jgi:hypothetical protein